MPRKRLRSPLETAGFQWSLNCFICSGLIDKHNLKRHPVAAVMTIPIREKLIKQAQGRKDDWGQTVLGRLLSCHDLVAAEAIYHLNCMTKFTLHIYTSEKRGRPVHSEMMYPFETVCSRVTFTPWKSFTKKCNLWAIQVMYIRRRA